MANFEVAVLLNEGDGRFDEYQAGNDKLVVGPVIAVKATTYDEALDLAYHIGNKMTEEQDYPREVRSVSVGDVLGVRNPETKTGQYGVWFTVNPAGFSFVPVAAVLCSLAFGLGYTNARSETAGLGNRIKDAIDRLPLRRFGPPWSRWNYVRRVDAYEAVDAALAAFEDRSHDSRGK